MAETLGIVASGIAVAQLGVATGGAVMKLKQIWDQVEDAPETISDLIERIDLIYPSVWDFEHQFTHSGLPPMLWDSTTALRSVAYCRKALKRLSDVVSDLSTQINSRRRFKRKFFAAKVALKNEYLKRLEGQLRNSLEILQFAQTTYMGSQQAMQSSCSTAIQPYEAEASSSNVREQEDEKAPTCTNSQSVRHLRRRTTSHWKPASSFGLLSLFTGPTEYGVEFRQPWWLAGLASSFTFHMSTYRSGWDVQLRLYSERSQNDSVFFMALEGDEAGLRSLFEQRQASPFDRDENGWTLLHYSLFKCQLEVTRFLIEKGVDLTQTDIDGETDMQLPDDDAMGPVSTMAAYPVPLPQQNNIEISTELSPNWSTDPSTICNEVWTEYGYSLLHMVVINLTVRQAYGLERSKLYEFAKDVMRMTVDLHPIEPGSDYPFEYYLPDIDITPFIRLILWNMSCESRFYLTIPKRANKRLQEWAKLLSEVGVDIEEYGQREHDILQDAISESFIHFEAGKLRWESSDEFPLKGCEICLYGFTYGPNVEDWTIICNEPTDQFAGEFWDLVEDRPLEMPGAWFD
ncbi:hypothetical protein PG984_010146 [Apiospora sp. TS-2023a]